MMRALGCLLFGLAIIGAADSLLVYCLGAAVAFVGVIELGRAWRRA